MFSVDINERIGVITKYPNGWKMELNIVSWCGDKPKFDIREWDSTHEHMSRGIKLNTEEARTLYNLLDDYFNNREV